MTTFFPTPYKGETFYSTISRYHIYSGNLTSKDTLRDLFNTTSVTAGRELPANIDLLLKNIPNNHSFTTNDIIFNNTLYKYYTCFLTKEKADYIYNLMANGNGSLIFASLGMCGNKMKNDFSLKYCPECVKSDRSVFGEAFWHLNHQIPGIFICPNHMCKLYICKKSTEVKNRQEYLNLEFSIGNNDKSIVGFNNMMIEHQERFIMNLNKIMNEKYQFKEMNFFREYYLKALIEKGMAESRVKIYQQDLLRDFKGYYSEDYLSLLGCSFDLNDKYNWVTTITRKHRKSFHPIQHLLMIEYLNIDIDELFNSEYMEVRKDNKRSDKNDEEKKIFREKWLELRKKYPNKNISFVRKLDFSTYRWLNKYDRKWLADNSPKKNGCVKSKRIDWQKRDEEILSRVRKAVKSIYNSREKPERVTVGAVGRKIGKIYLLQKSLDKMPMTKEYLQKECESIKQFQDRRVKWVRENVTINGESEWIVMRKAGIR